MSSIPNDFIVNDYQQCNSATFPKNAVFTKNLSEIEEIASLDKNLLIYFWEPSQQLIGSIESQRFNYLSEFEFVIDKQDIASLHSMGKDDLSIQVLAEFQEIANHYSRLIPEEKILIRFEKTKKQPCPLFHIDRVSLRLICALRGPGPEWLDNSTVNRDSLGKGSNENVVTSDAFVQRANTFQVCLLKGEAYTNSFNRQKGIVHRSPPTLEAERWILKMDGKSLI